MSHEKQNILFIPAWYPNRDDSMFGLFVKNHALAVAPFTNISVIYVQSSNNNKDNFEQVLNSNEDINEIIIYFKKSNITFIGAFINLFRMLRSYKMGWDILLKQGKKPQITHAHILTRAGVIAYIINKLYNIPYIITEHWSRYYAFNNNYNGILRKYLTQKVVKNASMMTTVSKSLKEAMNKCNLHNDNWQILANSINTELFKYSPTTYKTDKVRIFHISCFEDKSKNVSGIIRAFKNASQQNPNLQLVMIGDGDDHKKMIELSQELNIDSKIEFTGVLEGKALIDKINSCHFKVLFSNYETFAIVLVESLAAGKPVIATNAGAIPEVLPKEYGIIIEPKDEKALSSSMLLMAKNYHKYDKKAMRKYAVDNYDISKIGVQLNKYYKQIITQ